MKTQINLTDQEKIKKYDELTVKRREYSRKHYNKNKKLVELYKEKIKELEMKLSEKK